MRNRTAAVALAFLSAPAAGADHDPLQTATIYVHGFDPNGASHEGVYGDDRMDPLLRDVADLVGFPTIDQPGGETRSNVVAATTYYGDTPPAYYTPADVTEVDTVTVEWGGGVPRYALIVAKYARHVMERSGADQVNFVSASFGSLVVRWLIERDVEGLASAGEIARWLSFEGLVGGNWAASNGQLLELWEMFDVPPVDVDHMHYDWIEANLHSPRTEADNALYANILLSHELSTDDTPNERALTNAMLVFGQFQPNDGVQGVDDARFHTVTNRSRLLGQPPLTSYLDVDHYELRDFPGAWAEAATFVTGTRRVTVTMMRAQVMDIHEPNEIFWDWTPAEVVFESWVYSPALASTWGITDPSSARHRDGASTPIREFDADGDERTFTHIVFDGFVLDSETQLDLELRAEEIDWDVRYGVTEPLEGSYDFLGGGWITVPIGGPGTYTFAVSDWNCELAVAVFDYPFRSVTGASPVVARSATRLHVFPNPSRGTVRVVAPRMSAAGVLSVFDVRGTLVRRLSGDIGAGVLWDGRDASGGPAPAGVYWLRFRGAGVEAAGRSTIVR